MKKILMMLVASSSLSLATAQESNKMEPFSRQSFAGQAIREVEAETSGGNIHVESSSADKTSIEIFVSPANGKNRSSVSKEELQKKLDELYNLEIGLNGGKLTAIAKSKSRKWDRKNSLSISFKIYVPQSVSTQLSTSGGNIVLSRLQGEQKITTSGGNLVIDHVKGKLKGTTSGGNIQVKDSEEEIQLTTSGGNILADNCKGSIKLTTSGGSVSLNKLSGNTEATTSGGNVHADGFNGDLQAHTSGGNIAINGLSGNLATGTSGGNVQVAITNPGKNIKIRNSGGDISLILPADKGYDLELNARKIKTGSLKNFNGKMDEGEISGQLNGGGSKIDVDGHNGNLSLTLK